MVIATDLAATIEEHGGVVVGTTSDPARAVRLGLELYPDTVLMDVVLNGRTDGIDTAHFIRDLVGSTIVFCTACTDPEALRRMKAVDSSAVVLKPVLSIELCQAIHRVMRKEKRA